MPFSNVARMCVCSLLPKPKTTVIGLGVGLVHMWNRELTRQRIAGTVVVVAKAYAIGKVLHLAAYFYSIAKKEPTHSFSNARVVM